MREQNSKKITFSSETSAQRQRLLDALLDRPLNTFEIREGLDIVASAARVLDLRRKGHLIETIPIDIWRGGCCHKNMALYVYQGFEVAGGAQ